MDEGRRFCVWTDDAKTARTVNGVVKTRLTSPKPCSEAAVDVSFHGRDKDMTPFVL